jgi:hypothetical protein
MRNTSWALLTALAVLPAFGSDPASVVEEEPPEEEEQEEPRPTLVGTVIASGAYDIVPVATADVTDPNFLIARRFEASLPFNLGPSAGKLLVLSVREVRNALECSPEVVFTTECGTMVVLEQDGPEPGRRPGRLTVSVPEPVTFYPWGDFVLRPLAEPT